MSFKKFLTENSKERIKKFLDSLQSLPAGDDYISPKKLGIKVFEWGTVRIPGRLQSLVKKAKPEPVSISSISTAQTYLQKSKILALFDVKPYPPVTIILQDGEYILIDGNHRLAAAKLRDERDVMAIILPSK